MSRVVASLRALRERRGLSQRALAARSSIPQPVVAAYESGSRQPGLANLEKLSAALGSRVEIAPFVDAEALLRTNPTLRREALLSLVLHHEIAIAVLRDPYAVRQRAKANVARMREVDRRGRARRWLDGWDQLIDGPLGPLLAAMVDPSDVGTDRRQCSPFAGVLDARLRESIIRYVREVWVAKGPGRAA